MEIDNLDLKAEIDKRERLGSCEVCDNNQAKYTCPKCEFHTCSLNCSKIHKKELECDGIRDKTKYIPLKKMTTMDFMNDYYFLEEATRFTKEIKGNWKVKGSKKINNKFMKLRKAAQQRKIKLFFLTSSLKKRKKNLSYYDFKTDSITWHVELTFINAELKTHIQVNENTIIADCIQRIIEETDNKQMEFYKACGLSKLKVLLKAEGLKRNQNRYYDLNMKKTLKANLSGKVIIEYPSISVVMDHCVDGFELIMSDDETIQNEQKEFIKTLQEEVFAKKIGENPMFVLNPGEIPIIADVINEDNQKLNKSIEGINNCGTSQPNVQSNEVVNELSDENDEVRPENYFF